MTELVQQDFNISCRVEAELVKRKEVNNGVDVCTHTKGVTKRSNADLSGNFGQEAMGTAWDEAVAVAGGHSSTSEGSCSNRKGGQAGSHGERMTLNE